MKPENKHLSLPCAVCRKPAFFSVGWLVPTRKDAHAETADTRPACSQKCALKSVRESAIAAIARAEGKEKGE